MIDESSSTYESTFDTRSGYTDESNKSIGGSKSSSSRRRKSKKKTSIQHNDNDSTRGFSNPTIIRLFIYRYNNHFLSIVVDDKKTDNSANDDDNENTIALEIAQEFVVIMSGGMNLLAATSMGSTRAVTVVTGRSFSLSIYIYIYPIDTNYKHSYKYTYDQQQYQCYF